MNKKFFYCQQITMLQLKRHSRVNWIKVKYEKSNKLVLTLEFLKRLMVNSACGINLSHSLIRKFLCHKDKPDSKWFFAQLLLIPFHIRELLNLCTIHIELHSFIKTTNYTTDNKNHDKIIINCFVSNYTFI